jgi:hypothetical protein
VASTHAQVRQRSVKAIAEPISVVRRQISDKAYAASAVGWVVGYGQRVGLGVTVLEDAFRIATKGLDVRQLRDRVACFYVRRRAQKLAQQHPEWNATQLSGGAVLRCGSVGAVGRGLCPAGDQIA